MNLSVRLAFCILVLMGCLAFLATALQPYKDLQQAKAVLDVQKDREGLVVREYDGRQRELNALQQNPEYRELRARDRLRYSEPDEHIFRIDR
jgi:cell division protein FtsB